MQAAEAQKQGEEFQEWRAAYLIVKAKCLRGPDCCEGGWGLDSIIATAAAQTHNGPAVSGSAGLKVTAGRAPPH